MVEDVEMKASGDTSAVKERGLSGLEYHLHPLVLINISDHCMRSRQMGAEGFPRVIGCLLGQHTGRSVDICNSFEMLEVSANGDASGEDVADIDHAIYDQRREQYAETFKSLDVIGWYATGEEVLARDMSLHRKVSENTEAPIFLLVNPKAAMIPGTRDLPATLYESAIHLVEGRPETFFVKAAHSMAASDAERIAVDAAAQVVSGKPVGENSALAQHYGGLSNSLSMLTERLEVLLDYLTKVQSGTVPTNQQVLRMTSGLVNKLRAHPRQDMSEELANDFTNTSLVNLLCLMTRGVHECQELVEVANSAYTWH